MNIRKLIENKITDNTFELVYKNNKITVYGYDKIKTVLDGKIVIEKDKNVIIIKGDNVFIESMFKEYLTISGTLKEVSFEVLDE